jgi:hypothetical protein
MATDYQTYANKLQRRAGLRRLLLAPPALLVCASLVLLVASPFSWDAAEIADLPAWIPPALGILTGLGGLWVGAFAFQRTLRETRGDFEVFALQLAWGVIMFISGSLMMLGLTDRLPDPDTYAHLLDDNGNRTITPNDYFAFSFLFGLLQIGWVWVGAYLYSHAMSNLAPNRISARRPDEVDGVGVLLRERS